MDIFFRFSRGSKRVNVIVMNLNLCWQGTWTKAVYSGEGSWYLNVWEVSTGVECIVWGCTLVVQLFTISCRI